MADLSDVSQALVTLIGAVLYPNGAAQPAAISPAFVFPGWPNPADLDKRLACGITSVSVYPAVMNRNTTRYMDQWQTVSMGVATLMLAIVGQTVVVSGVVTASPQNLVIFANGKPYVYQSVPSDTLSSIALALMTMIRPDVPSTSSTGPVINFPPAARINTVRVGVTGVSANEIRRQEQVYQIGIWASKPDVRDNIAKAVDQALAAIRRFILPDTSVCRLIWKNSQQSDRLEKENLFRRDLFYTAEFPTLATEIDTQITVIQENVSVSVAGVEPYQPVATVYE